MTAVVRGKMCTMQTHKRPPATSSSYLASVHYRGNCFPEHQLRKRAVRQVTQEKAQPQRVASRRTQRSKEFGNKLLLPIISLHYSVISSTWICENVIMYKSFTDWQRVWSIMLNETNRKEGNLGQEIEGERTYSKIKAKAKLATGITFTC